MADKKKGCLQNRGCPSVVVLSGTQVLAAVLLIHTAQPCGLGCLGSVTKLLAPLARQPADTAASSVSSQASHSDL